MRYAAHGAVGRGQPNWFPAKRRHFARRRKENIIAAVIPVLVSFASAGAAVTAAGSVAAALSTVSGFLSIAGAALTTVGAISGNKDAKRIGGFMSLGGGIGTAFNAYTAGSSVAEAASAADMAGGMGGGLGGDAALGTSAGYDGFMGAAGEAGKLGGSLMDTARAASSISPDMARQAVGDFGSQVMDGAQATAATSGASPPLFEPSMHGSQPIPTQDMGQGLTQGLPSAGGASHTSELARGASTMNQSELMGLLKDAAGKTGKTLNGVAEFLTKNKELVKIGGDMLGGMYGPQAEQLDFNKSIYNRRMANVNKPVKLYYGGA